MDRKTYMSIVLINILQCFYAFKMPFEAGHATYYEGYTSGHMKLEYFNRTEKNFRGKLILNSTGEDWSAKLTVLVKKGNTWALHGTYHSTVCNMWNNEKYLFSQILEQTNTTCKCPFPIGTTLNVNGIHLDPTAIMKMIPTEESAPMAKYVLEISCKGEKAFDFWADIIYDHTDDKKKRKKPGYQRPPKNKNSTIPNSA